MPLLMLATHDPSLQHLPSPSQVRQRRNKIQEGEACRRERKKWCLTMIQTCSGGERGVEAARRRGATEQPTTAATAKQPVNLSNSRRDSLKAGQAMRQHWASSTGRGGGGSPGLIRGVEARCF